MTFRTFFFDWTTLKRFFVDHKDNIVNVVQTDTDTDVMMEKETQNKETTKTTCYSSTKRWVEESNRMYAKKVEEDAKKMREKKKRINTQMLRVLKNHIDSASTVKEATRIFLLRKRSRDESNASAKKY
jgi:hypothetical protein